MTSYTLLWLLPIWTVQISNVNWIEIMCRWYTSSPRAGLPDLKMCFFFLLMCFFIMKSGRSRAKVKMNKQVLRSSWRGGSYTLFLIYAKIAGIFWAIINIGNAVLVSVCVWHRVIFWIAHLSQIVDIFMHLFLSCFGTWLRQHQECYLFIYMVHIIYLYMLFVFSVMFYWWKI